MTARAGRQVGKMEAEHAGQVEMLMVMTEQNSHWMAKNLGIRFVVWFFGGFFWCFFFAGLDEPWLSNGTIAGQG